jgi:hypothetical protein
MGVAVVAGVAGACSGRSIRHDDRSGTNAGEPSDHPGGSSGLGGGGSSGTSVAGGSVSTNGGGAGVAGTVVAGGTGGSRSTNGGGAGVAGTVVGGTGGDGGAQDCTPNGECWDGRQCRVELERSDCPQTYDAARAVSVPPLDGFDCLAPTRDGFVYRTSSPYWQTTCSYDPDGTLRGFRRGEDCECYCDERSFEIMGGTLPTQFELEDFDFYRGCYLGSDFSAVSASPLMHELYPSFGTVGKSCEPGADECRGAILLLACLDADGSGTYCQTCETDEQCREEYPYLGDDVRCEPGGLCRVSARPIGSCTEGTPTSVCNTGQGAFVCDEGVCARCTTDDQCAATDAGETCSSDGDCVTAFH